MIYWWHLLGWVGRAHFELERMMSPYSPLLGRNVTDADFVMPTRKI